MEAKLQKEKDLSAMNKNSTKNKTDDNNNIIEELSVYMFENDSVENKIESSGAANNNACDISELNDA